jgi:alpha-glucosidase (family GH31 glycosyl hydrolase)
LQLPSPEVLTSPIWTTWARYKAKVDQAKVLRYAQEIADRGLSRSVMEIDDKWQTTYGDLAFDPRKFPDAVGMVDQLHALGFKVTCWVHPFCERKSDAYKEGAAKGYFVGTQRPAGTGVASSVPAFFPWWNTPLVAAVDVTNPEAVEWFVARCFLPRNPVTHTPLATPADYTRLYVQRVAGRFAGGVSEVRTGHLTQDVAIMTRMGDRFSTWDQANGLRSIIPTLLTSGLLGYPFCLPDMIGGNAYFGAKPDAELMVRWAQANALMPAMQFSIAPWDLSRDAERLVASALGVRKRLEGLMLRLAEEAAQTLTPICRPLWFLDAGDETTYEIHDQFALGQDVIVAPVVHQGASTRDVYLTAGLWRDVNEDRVVEGGQWLRALHAPLDRIPVFVREGVPGLYMK